MNDPVLNLSVRIAEFEAAEDTAHAAGNRNEAERLYQCGVAEWERFQFTEPTTPWGVVRLLDYLSAGGLAPSFDQDGEWRPDGWRARGPCTTTTFDLWPTLDQVLRLLIGRGAPLPLDVVALLAPMSAGAQRDGYPELANCLDRMAAWAAGFVMSRLEGSLGVAGKDVKSTK